MSLVLDASVALSWAFDDEGGEYGTAVLQRLRSAEAVVPTLWPLEVANALAVGERRGRLTAAESARYARLLLSLPISMEPAERSGSLESTLRLARNRGLSAYDACYLDLAIRYGLPLATLDGTLRSAAEAEGVEVFEPS
ncbi:MAG: type II toxin-antitoxin system VapC family toxin [Gemmatimonadetes bacterium]|nr:type II toxin-antitoxin system VapC family toxin [Gemmatimonadota bacterium]NNK64992.1 type II toxin-antitoxin system VapC family toxin [Gemmatimonadota bacterium]